MLPLVRWVPGEVKAPKAGKTLTRAQVDPVGQIGTRAWFGAVRFASLTIEFGLVVGINSRFLGKSTPSLGRHGHCKGGTPMQHRAGQRGISRLELILAFGLLAVIGTTTILVTRPSLASAEHASEKQAATLIAALSKWQADHPSGCPTLGLLQSQGYLDADTPREDAWGGSFRVACADAELTLLSPGPDAKLDTSDDLRIAVR